MGVLTQNVTEKFWYRLKVECHHHCMLISEKERALFHREIRKNIFTNDWNRFSLSSVSLLIFWLKTLFLNIDIFTSVLPKNHKRKFLKRRWFYANERTPISYRSFPLSEFLTSVLYTQIGGDKSEPDTAAPDSFRKYLFNLSVPQAENEYFTSSDRTNNKNIARHMEI